MLNYGIESVGMDKEQEQSHISLIEEIAPPGPVGTKILFESATSQVTHTITVEKNGSWKDSITVHPKHCWKDLFRHHPKPFTLPIMITKPSPSGIR